MFGGRGRSLSAIACTAAGCLVLTLAGRALAAPGTEPWLRPDGTVGYQHRKGPCPAKLAKQHTPPRTIATSYLEVQRLAVFEGFDACTRALGKGFSLGVDDYEPFVTGQVSDTTQIRKVTAKGSLGTVAPALEFRASVVFDRPDATNYVATLTFDFLLGKDKVWTGVDTTSDSTSYGISSVPEIWYLRAGSCFLQFGARPDGRLASQIYAVVVPCTAPGAFQVAATPPLNPASTGPSNSDFDKTRLQNAEASCRASIGTDSFTAFAPTRIYLEAARVPIRNAICVVSASGAPIGTG
jgi:hypothetical protein